MRLALALFVWAAAASAAAAAALVPDAPVVPLDEVGIYEIGYAYRGEPEQRFRVGWSGSSEETGVTYHPVGEQEGRQAVLMHCPWRGGTGITFQEFTFALPRVKRIALRGATAMSARDVEKSDGATFRIFVNGQPLLDTHRTDAQWQAFELDLSAFGGKTAAIRFETDPGPRDNSSYDHSLWGDRELVLRGYAPEVVERPTPPPLSLARVRSAPEGGVAPRSGWDGETTVTLVSDAAVFEYRGPDGRLTYRWRLPGPDADPLFGAIELTAHMAGGDAAQAPLAVAPLAAGARAVWVAPAIAIESRWEPIADGVRCVREFRVGGDVARLSISGRMQGKSLVLSVMCDRPLIEVLDAGAWGPVARRRALPIPYYSGRVQYLPAQDLFVNVFLDWTEASATRHGGTRAYYEPLTDGARNTLREIVIYTAAWHLAEVLPNIPNARSPRRAELGSRLVLDLWDGSFEEIADYLQRLADYGIVDEVVLIHNWQRSGYDNALPMHVPANAQLGGEEKMRALIDTGKGLGHYMALHENYVDYYPNYDFFTEADIALDSTGERQLAWFNPGTGVQSFAVKPNAILRLAATQSPEIHRRYGTNASFIDVHSAVPPWFHVDARAGERGAGVFRRVWDVHRRLWKYERTTHQGPVFGEGWTHWYWSGCLDGVEAQLGAGWPHEAGMTAPLMVDFDLLKIHPLQLNHGMGYFERWWPEAPWGASPPMIVLDQYRMQEVAYGHAGFPYVADRSAVGPVWLEHYLLTPVTARYAGADAVDIAYEVDGAWVDGTAAPKAGRWARVRVRYDSGVTVTANGGETPLRVGSVVLPQFGWLAEGPDVSAYTALRDGVVVDYAETADSVFANARNVRDWVLRGYARAELRGYAQTARGEFRVSYRWQAERPLDRDYTCFVHFCSPEEGEAIRFQQDHALPLPTSTWREGETLTDGPYTIRMPDDLPDGEYRWYIGLYLMETGRRIPLEGETDNQRRTFLGTLSVRDGGTALEFSPAPDTASAREAKRREHTNTAGASVDFGPVRTDGSVAIQREGKEWVLRAFPRERPFAVELSARRFPPPRSIACVDGASESVTPELTGERWRLPLNGATAYRWRAAESEARPRTGASAGGVPPSRLRSPAIGSTGGMSLTVRVLGSNPL